MILRDLRFILEKYTAEILKKQSYMRAQMSQLLEDVRTLLGNIKLNEKDAQVTEYFLKKFDFPLKKEEDLQELEEHLNNEDNFSQAVSDNLCLNYLEAKYFSYKYHIFS